MLTPCHGHALLQGFYFIVRLYPLTTRGSLSKKYKCYQNNGHNKRKKHPDRPFKQIHNFPQFHLKVFYLFRFKDSLPIQVTHGSIT